jgi:peptidoglycan LD-endopeptidase LytH
MKKSNVRLLQFVRKGEKIGEVGDTGNALGKPHHLHFFFHGNIAPFLEN